MFKRRSRLIFVLPITFFFAHFIRMTSNDRRKKNVLCVNNDLITISPTADGLVMKPNFLPFEWAVYESAKKDTDQRIFFHETSGVTELSMKQCCAVESAAKHNPNRPVQLFLRPPKDCATFSATSSSSSPFYNPPWLEILSLYPNVEVVLINEGQYFSRTPLEDWYIKGDWRKSKYEIAHLSDYIRILTLYKGGGLYLDIDILTIKALKGEIFRNFLVYGNAGMEEISNGAMHMERDHWLSSEIIGLIFKEYDPDAYVYHGPDAISEIMNRVCGLLAGMPKSNQCGDVQILSDQFFYPIPSIFSHILFEDNQNGTENETLSKIKNTSFGVHLWHSLSRLHKPLRLHSNQILAVLARENCPLTVGRANDFQ